MRAATTTLGLGALLLATGPLGCAKGELLRTREQWRDDIAVQMTPLADEFRACYVKSKAAWADHAKRMQGGKTVAADMQPKARETVLIDIHVDNATADPPQITTREGYDKTVPKEELTSDGSLSECVRGVVRKNLKVPPKLDTNQGFGTWRVVFVPDAPTATPTVAPASPPKT